MNVGRICSRAAHLADPGESAQAAAERMRQENVGALIALDENRRPIGIVTDRDLALRVVGRGLDGHATKVAEVMTTHPRWVKELTSIEVVAETMRTLGVRRLPVVDEGEHLVGIVSVDDVLGHLHGEMNDVRRVVGMSHPGTHVLAERPASP